MSELIKHNPAAWLVSGSPFVDEAHIEKFYADRSANSRREPKISPLYSEQAMDEVCRQRDEALAELRKLHALLDSGDWSVLRGDYRMTLPYDAAEKAAEELEAFINRAEHNADVTGLPERSVCKSELT